jgi:hypothetical protein
LISNACSGIAVRLPMASGAVLVRTNCLGSVSPLTTGGSCYRWSQKNCAKNCQLKKLRRETMPKCVPAEEQGPDEHEDDGPHDKGANRGGVELPSHDLSFLAPARL